MMSEQEKQYIVEQRASGKSFAEIGRALGKKSGHGSLRVQPHHGERSIKQQYRGAASDFRTQCPYL